MGLNNPTNPMTGMLAIKTVTFDGSPGNGAVGTVALFTGTGEYEVIRIGVLCLADLVEAAPTATISLGLPGAGVSAFIAATAAAGAGATGIDVNEGWLTTTPFTRGQIYAATTKDVLVIDGNDIIFNILGQNITGGILRTHVNWRPASANGLLIPV